MTSLSTGFRALPLPIIQLSLAAVLKCGQSFRWTAYPLKLDPEDASSPTHEYRFCLRDRVVCLRQTATNILYRTVQPDPQPNANQRELRDAETLLWLKDYFQLDVDLAFLYEEWGSRDKVFLGIQDRFSGIRMLRQDPWENLISFICSSNNNISRITKMVQSLSKEYSPPLLSLPTPDGSGVEDTYHPFPPPSALTHPDVSARLRSLGFGYRAEFIHRTAKMLVETHGDSIQPQDSDEPSEQWLRTLRDISTEDARAELLKFVGVGRKVADCVLLMSLDKTDVVPVDTHVHQIAIKHYGMKGSTKGKMNMTPKLYEELCTKFVQVWGQYAGWAHSVLFTSDLKSFALHGLLEPTSPLPSPVKNRKKRSREMTDLVRILPTPPSTPSVSESATATEIACNLSPAERVKKRIRK
ncbi:DNA glycosylase [Lentinula detonsa]|uniref:DNA-(apurinic or apyrimidinic site) lyase n=1 Tax=Lentinula detonsa TaxID=2804962 RepID=A0A9W8P151_9AGAR|nr:DNA glycosylase [Lentinula detonsa]